MGEPDPNGAAIVIAGLCLALALQVLVEARPEWTCITLRVEGPLIVVDTLDPDSRGGGNPENSRPGMVVTEVDNTPVDDIPLMALDRYLEGYFVELGVALDRGGDGTVVLPSRRGSGFSIFPIRGCCPVA